MQRRKARTRSDFIVTDLKGAISSQKAEFLFSWALNLVLRTDGFICVLLPAVIYNKPMKIKVYTLSQILTNHVLLEGVASSGYCVSLHSWKNNAVSENFLMPDGTPENYCKKVKQFLMD